VTRRVPPDQDGTPMTPSRPRIALATASALVALAMTLGLAPGPDRRPMEALWDDLEKDDFEASRALLAMSARPKEAVDFLKLKLKPLTIDPEKARALIDWLGNDEEEVWKRAFEELEYFDPRLAIDLETLMNEVKETPARQRLVEVMSGRPAGSLGDKTVSLRGTGGDGFNFFDGRGSWWAEVRVDRINHTGWGGKKKWTRAVRAIVLLEHIATPEAVAILKEMATGRPDAQPTKAAAESLARATGPGK
jgi:hypothetical protein